MNKHLLFIFLVGSIFLNTYAQNGTGLIVGDKAPNLVLPTAKNTEQSFVFPYNNKIVLVFFWSSSVSSSQENLFKYAKVNKRYGSSEYKTCDGFEMISVALQSDIVAWGQDLIKYNLLKLNNCIALKGYQDYFVKSYKLTQTPTSFLIDEFGKIIIINPDISTIIDYLNGRKNTLSNGIVQNSITGRLFVGDNLNPLKNSPVYVLNDKKDTIQKVMTDEVGMFYVNNINTDINLTLSTPINSQITEEQKVYVASENSEILSACQKTPTGSYECKVLDMELFFLKPLKEMTTNGTKSTNELTDITISEDLHKIESTTITKEVTAKLEAVLNKLKANPKSHIEIISHTDCKGDAKANTELTHKRAMAISNYFTSKGIVKTRIKAIGKGEVEPLNKCKDGVTCSEAENEVNRLTVLKFYLNE
jgi:outer membrane protein OmpA-like peptidoglycan-associated protein